MTEDVDTLFPPQASGADSAARDVDELFPPSVGARASAAQASSPIHDFLFGNEAAGVPAPFSRSGRLLSAFGQGAKQGWGAEPMGLSDETEQALKKAGVFNDYANGRTSFIKSMNEALMRPAAVALDATMRAGTAAFRGAQDTTVELGDMMGAPNFARDVAAMPEAFMGTPHPMGVPKVPDIAKARELGIIGAGEEGWKGTAPVAEPVEASHPRADVKETQISGQLDPHAAANEQAPAAIAEAPASPAAPVAPTLPPVPEGMTRFYHGGDEPTSGGGRWLTPDYAYARNFRSFGEPKNVHYVDIPTDSPLLKKAFDDTGTDQTAPFISFEAPEEIAKQLKPVPAQAPGAQGTIGKVDQSHEVVSGAVASKDTPGVTYIDPRIPEFSPILKDKDGNPADLHKYLTIHEQTERQAMAEGVPYDEAHTNRATVAERAAVEADGVDWKKYSEEIDGYLAKIEHEKATNPPPDPHINPEAAIGEKTGRGDQPPASQDVSRETSSTSPSIASDVTEKLIAAGRPAEEAQASAQLIQAYWQARAERFKGAKGTAEEMYRAEGSEIKPGGNVARASKAREFAQSDQPTVQEVIDLASQPGHSHAVAPIGITSDWLSSAAAERGFDIKDFDHVVDTSAVRHIINRHGGPAEAARGGIPIAPEDIAALPETLSSPDKVAFGAKNQRGMPLIAFLKKMPDGSTIVLEEVRSRNLAVASLRKYPPTINVLGNVDLYVRNDGGAPLDVVDVPKSVNAVDQHSLSQGSRGKITFRPGGRSVITLMKDANASTFIHETGHEWLDRLLRDARDEKAPDDLKADAETVQKWLGVDSPDKIKTRHHEQFARAFEAYMREGKAPTQALASVFAKFKNWLSRIYRTVTALRVPINDDIRGVFDRLLAGEPSAERDPGQGFADLHEADAEATPPERAHPVAATIEGERDKVAATHHPEGEDARLQDTPEEARRRAAGNSQPDRNGDEGAGPQEGGATQEPGTLGEGRGEAQGGGARSPVVSRAGRPTEPPVNPGNLFAPSESHLVDKAGNIRLDNLNTPEDINAVLREAANSSNDFIEARRGVLSDAEVLGLADALGMDAKKLNARKIGQAFNAEEIIAARKLLIQSATDVRDAMAKAADGTEADVMAYAEAKTRHLMIQEQVSGITAEAGRALRAFRAIGEDGDKIKAVGEFLKGAVGKTLFQLKEEAQLGLALDTPQQVSKFIQDSQKASFGDMVLEYWINGLISGPATHTTYSVGNALLALWRAGPETAAASGIGAIRAAFGSEAPRVFAGEVPAQLYGMMKGVREGVVAAWQAAKTGQTTMLPGELEAMTPAKRASSLMLNPKESIPGPIGTVIRIPSRGVAVIHSFFRAMNYAREMAGLAYRQAASEGLTGDAFAARVGEISTDPEAALMEQARASATDLTLMGKGGALTQALSSLTNAKFLGFQWLKFIDPFVHISSNVIEQAILQRTPVGILAPEIRATVMGEHGPVARDLAIGRMAVGSALGVAVGSLAAEGLVNGSGPSDPKEARIYALVNGPPHSVRIGDTWYDIHRLGPLGMLVSISADLYEVAHKIGEEDGAHAAHNIAHAFTQNILDESFMRGPADLIRALTDPDRYGAGWVRNFVASFTPFSVGSSQVARAVDPYSRSARTILDAVKAKIPWLSETLLPRRDIFGEPIPNKDVLGVAGLSAIYEQKVNNDPTAQALLDAGIFPAMPERKIRGVALTDQQYDDYSRVAGRMTKLRLDAIVKMPGFNQLPQGTKVELLGSAIKNSREAARSLILMQYPQIITSAVDAKTAKLRGEKPK